MLDIQSVIAQRLRQCRNEQQWTVEETAKKLTILPSRYSNWEQALRTPKYSQILDLANLFNKPASWIAGFTEREVLPHFITVNQPTISVKDTSITLECVSDNSAFNISYIKQRGLNQDKLITIFAPDDSMAPLIRKGDELLIDLTENTVKLADLFAILVNSQVWIRWIRPEIDNCFTVAAEDSEYYPDIKLSKDDTSALEIIGRVARISKDR